MIHPDTVVKPWQLVPHPTKYQNTLNFELGVTASQEELLDWPFSSPVCLPVSSAWPPNQLTCYGTSLKFLTIILYIIDIMADVIGQGFLRQQLTSKAW